MSFGALNSTTCASVANTVLLRTLPNKGVVKFIEIKEPFPPKFPACVGQTANRTLLQYTPAADKLGFDRFFILETGGPQGPKEHEVIIWIGDPKAPNTAAPSRASLDQLYGPPKTLEI